MKDAFLLLTVKMLPEVCREFKGCPLFLSSVFKYPLFKKDTTNKSTHKTTESNLNSLQILLLTYLIFFFFYPDEIRNELLIKENNESGVNPTTPPVSARDLRLGQRFTSQQDNDRKHNAKT